MLPVHELKQPSIDKILKFNQYTVKYEKILMTAKESKGESKLRDAFIAMSQVLDACCLEKNFKSSELPIFDFESLFLQLRAVSVTNKEIANITDNFDGKDYQCVINFDDVKVIFPEQSPEKLIKLKDGRVIELRYPPAEFYLDIDDKLIDELKAGQLFQLIASCVNKVYNKDVLVKMNKKQLEDFLDDLEIPVYRKMKDFLMNVPKLYYRIEYVNSLGNERYIEFKSIMDFFLFL